MASKPPVTKVCCVSVAKYSSVPECPAIAYIKSSFILADAETGKQLLDIPYMAIQSMEGDLSNGKMTFVYEKTDAAGNVTQNWLNLMCPSLEVCELRCAVDFVRDYMHYMRPSPTIHYYPATEGVTLHTYVISWPDSITRSSSAADEPGAANDGQNVFEYSATKLPDKTASLPNQQQLQPQQAHLASRELPAPPTDAKPAVLTKKPTRPTLQPPPPPATRGATIAKPRKPSWSPPTSPRAGHVRSPPTSPRAGHVSSPPTSPKPRHVKSPPTSLRTSPVKPLPTAPAKPKREAPHSPNAHLTELAGILGRAPKPTRLPPTSPRAADHRSGTSREPQVPPSGYPTQNPGSGMRFQPQTSHGRVDQQYEEVKANISKPKPPKVAKKPKVPPPQLPPQLPAAVTVAKHHSMPQLSIPKQQQQTSTQGTAKASPTTPRLDKPTLRLPPPPSTPPAAAATRTTLSLPRTAKPDFKQDKKSSPHTLPGNSDGYLALMEAVSEHSDDDNSDEGCYEKMDCLPVPPQQRPSEEDNGSYEETSPLVPAPQHRDSPSLPSLPVLPPPNPVKSKATRRHSPSPPALPTVNATIPGVKSGKAKTKRLPPCSQPEFQPRLPSSSGPTATKSPEMKRTPVVVKPGRSGSGETPAADEEGEGQYEKMESLVVPEPSTGSTHVSLLPPQSAGQVYLPALFKQAEYTHVAPEQRPGEAQDYCGMDSGRPDPVPSHEQPPVSPVSQLDEEQDELHNYMEMAPDAERLRAHTLLDDIDDLACILDDAPASQAHKSRPQPLPQQDPNQDAEEQQQQHKPTQDEPDYNAYEVAEFAKSPSSDNERHLEQKHQQQQQQQQHKPTQDEPDHNAYEVAELAESLSSDNEEYLEPLDHAGTQPSSSQVERTVEQDQEGDFLQVRVDVGKRPVIQNPLLPASEQGGNSHCTDHSLPSENTGSGGPQGSDSSDVGEDWEVIYEDVCGGEDGQRGQKYKKTKSKPDPPPPTEPPPPIPGPTEPPPPIPEPTQPPPPIPEPIETPPPIPEPAEPPPPIPESPPPFPDPPPPNPEPETAAPKCQYDGAAGSPAGPSEDAKNSCERKERSQLRSRQSCPAMPAMPSHLELPIRSAEHDIPTLGFGLQTKQQDIPNERLPKVPGTGAKPPPVAAKSTRPSPKPPTSKTTPVDKKAPRAGSGPDDGSEIRDGAITSQPAGAVKPPPQAAPLDKTAPKTDDWGVGDGSERRHKATTSRPPTAVKAKPPAKDWNQKRSFRENDYLIVKRVDEADPEAGKGPKPRPAGKCKPSAAAGTQTAASASADSRGQKSSRTEPPRRPVPQLSPRSTSLSASGGDVKAPPVAAPAVPEHSLERFSPTSLPDTRAVAKSSGKSTLPKKVPPPAIMPYHLSRVDPVAYKTTTVASVIGAMTRPGQHPARGPVPPSAPPAGGPKAAPEPAPSSTANHYDSTDEFLAQERRKSRTYGHLPSTVL